MTENLMQYFSIYCLTVMTVLQLHYTSGISSKLQHFSFVAYALSTSKLFCKFKYMQHSYQ